MIPIQHFSMRNLVVDTSGFLPEFLSDLHLLKVTLAEGKRHLEQKKKRECKFFRNFSDYLRFQIFKLWILGGGRHQALYSRSDKWKI
ncbi:hypothetical protein EGR_04366 [Echinococcus granulosus]|uniref:Uncharacterized protein n=1 Tax=Echinococcus granulosus TaxID=6210 RepID=W6UGT6_ECHGR|nr:hypothetical protein EGR_04366 [Echinococcus granulosus]EUB60740.1 hypothetical protein EGR_04366 [Echinococcus granulosus]